MSNNSDHVNGHRTGRSGARPTKACVGCRRQKMKCEPERGGPCRRCRVNKIECVFKPRANARSPSRDIIESILVTGETSSDILRRLAVIESVLGINTDQTSTTQVASSNIASVATIDEEEGNASLSGLWRPTANLRRFTDPRNTKIWSRSVVSQLWVSFYENMEGLHFQSEREAAKDPTPLLLAAILYVSALHHTSEELAALAPEYLRATCSAIAELSIPSALKRSGLMPMDETTKPPTAEQIAFQNVLGLILAGLISEAFIDLTGIWISVGYRLTLDHCPVYIDERATKWRQLFSGLQIIDLEHASLHLSCTVIPLKAPLPSLRQLQSFTEDPFHRLTEMMHAGLSHFTGRSLPTIWSFISSTQSEEGATPNFPFTDMDAEVIRTWAKNLDDWLVSSNKPNNTEYERMQIMRQYNLHRLFVLSIYHPARGFDLFANNVASAERHELLLSARATLRLQDKDKGIWANWDLVMITWAAILVLQGAEGGVGEHDDLLLVNGHLNKLQKTHRPAPSLHHTLANRLETWLQGMNTPPASGLQQSNFDPTWSLFDQNSIRLVSESNYEQDGLSSVAIATRPLQDSNATLDIQQQQSFGDNESWNAFEHQMETWPSNLVRLFGNATFQHTNNESNHFQ
ncbi:hypothetical protein K504DRAFT_483431 [Pleomassaria siparia CBS 279.74]|uniref:Zn(2)-C6 fungal-type domain-containing protein n=1 Tax=Pleomassaria siparia CBS 279.74 TaxID=1314801 RepID=A0A6G1K4K7_9PLEO|nr:hypothetical protein K504DRAFT_483431 [Pleomassaria siparia CBS 279.74]